MSTYLRSLINEFCLIMTELAELTNKQDPSEGFCKLDFTSIEILDEPWSKNYPIDFQIFGLVYFAISGTMYVCTEEPEKGSVSEIYQTYMDFNNDLTFAGSDIQLEDVMITGYSANAFHVFGYDATENHFKFLDTHGAVSYFELIVDTTTKVFEDFMHPVFLTENGIKSVKIDILLSRLGHWYGSLDPEKLAGYIDEENSKNWIGKDLYKRKLESHQNNINQLQKKIAVIKSKLIDLEERGFTVVRQKVNIDEIPDRFPLSYKLFLSEIGELKILNNKTGQANKSCFEVFSPIKVGQFIEIQKRQDLPVNFKDGDVFITLPRNQITSVDIVFVGQSKEEIGAFQTNKYLQYPFLINTDRSQRYPSDNFLSWVSVRIDIENLS